MPLRVVTTVLMIAGLVLVFSFPWLVGPRPESASARDLESYTVRFGVYVMSLLILFFTTMVMAFIAIRRAQAEFRETSLQNMQELVEGTLRDHQQKQGSSES
jgi:uncharacterized membrane protein (DUF485 family)